MFVVVVVDFAFVAVCGKRALSARGSDFLRAGQSGKNSTEVHNS